MARFFDTIDKQGQPKTYLGDGAYARADEFGNLVLTAEDGLHVNQLVVLGPREWDKLRGFADDHQCGCGRLGELSDRGQCGWCASAGATPEDKREG